jgi:hypothetical protein
MDPGGFYTGGDRLHDMQSQSTIFLLKIVLTKEAKESFLLFDDVFQFFCLAGLTPEEFKADEKSLKKFNWDALQDFRPLNITSATDMAADWKLVGLGCKPREMFCSLCTCQSSLVHQPNGESCEQFCADKVNDVNWK